MPFLADRLVEPAIILYRDRVTLDESHSGVVDARRLQLIGRAQLEVRSNDFDDWTQCCLIFSRCRAALARLPHVAMSHQRRRPFLVLSKKTRWQRWSAHR